MTSSKKPSYTRNLTTNSQWTGVKDPRPSSRFSLDDRVAWDRGGYLIIGIITKFHDEEFLAEVRLEDGRKAVWPTFSPRMRRIQTPDFVDDVNEVSDDSTNVEAVTYGDLGPEDPSEYYDELVTSEDRTPVRTTQPDFEYETTKPGGET